MRRFILKIITILAFEPYCWGSTANMFEVTRGAEDKFQYLENQGLVCDSPRTETDGTKICECTDEKKTMIFDDGVKKSALCKRSREVLDQFKHQKNEGI